MDTEQNNSLKSGKNSSQPAMDAGISAAVVTAVKAIYDISKDTGILYANTKPFYQIINSDFYDNKHQVELIFTNTNHHAIKILELFEKGKRALTNNLLLELRERREYFSNGHFSSVKYYKESGHMAGGTEDAEKVVAEYPFLIKPNFSYQLRISIPFQPRSEKGEALGISLSCIFSALNKLKNSEETINVRLFWPD